jgi:hypothetical protein
MCNVDIILISCDVGSYVVFIAIKDFIMSYVKWAVLSSNVSVWKLNIRKSSAIMQGEGVRIVIWLIECTKFVTRNHKPHLFTLCVQLLHAQNLVFFAEVVSANTPS